MAWRLPLVACFARTWRRAGWCVPLHRHSSRQALAITLVYPDRVARDRKLQAFREWLFEEIERERQQDAAAPPVVVPGGAPLLGSQP